MKLLQVKITNRTLVLQVEPQTPLNSCIFSYSTNFTPVSFIHYICSLRTESGKERILGLPMLFSIFVTSLPAAFSSFCQFKLQCAVSQRDLATLNIETLFPDRNEPSTFPTTPSRANSACILSTIPDKGNASLKGVYRKCTCRR